MSATMDMTPLPLSDLVNSDNVSDEIYGVLVDTFCANRISNVKRISFKAAMDEDEADQFSFDVMDTLIQYRQAKAQVLLEVPFDFPMPASDTLLLVNSIGAGIILPTPEDKTPANWAKWSSVVLDYARALLTVQNFSHEILPITSYVEYMAMRVMGYTPQSLTDNKMMFEYFERGMDTDTMNDLKTKLNTIIVDAHGGQEGFEGMVHSTLSALKESVSASGSSRVRSFADTIASKDQDRVSGLANLLVADLGITQNPDEAAKTLAYILMSDQSDVVKSVQVLQLLDHYPESDKQAGAGFAQIVSHCTEILSK